MKRALLHIDSDPLDARSLRWAHEAGLKVIGTAASEAGLDQLHVDHFQALPSDDFAGLMSLAESEVHGASDDSSSNRLAGIFSSKKAQQHAIAQLGQAFGLPTPSPLAVQRALDPAAQRAHLTSVGIRCVEGLAVAREALRFSINAFFRDGDFVRGGIVEHCELQSGQPNFGFQGHLQDQLEDELYAAFENAARELELHTGPVAGHAALDSEGLALDHLWPCFDDALMSSYLAPLALGKSPIQAWFAALAEAGGPFDSMPHRPIGCAGWMAIRSHRNGVLESVAGLDRARACAGIEGVRSMLPAGSQLERNCVVALLWASGEDAQHLESRLRAAGQHLNLRLDESSAA